MNIVTYFKVVNSWRFHSYYLVLFCLSIMFLLHVCLLAGSYVFGSIGLFVYLFVCLCATLLKNLQIDCSEILWWGPGWVKEELVLKIFEAIWV